MVETYTRVGVPEDKLKRLAWILLAGASGLIAGLLWPPIGVAAGIGLVVYFLLAIAAHVRANNAKNLVAPVVMELLGGDAHGSAVVNPRALTLPPGEAAGFRT